MAFSRPTPPQILDSIQTEFDLADLPGVNARLRRSVEFATSRSLSMAIHELYGYLDYISRQILVSTADTENLERHASEWGILRKSASPASGLVQFTGTNGSIIPAGAAVKRSDDVEYTVDNDILITAGIGSGFVTAGTLHWGTIGNASSVLKLTLMSPIAGVNSEGTVQAPGLVSGSDVESDDALRLRIIARIQQPPHGGAVHDYIAWALSVPGVTRAWCYPEQLGDGTVSVTFVMDNKIGSIIPALQDVADVAAYIETVRPATADVTVFAPAPEPVDFSITLEPNSAAVTVNGDGTMTAACAI